ncbi:MAG: M1 family metallopeptidase [Bacteroidetes bacterium]|nr:M1 family metallopeptidase [Bacteroidota bacterium]
MKTKLLLSSLFLPAIFSAQSSAKAYFQQDVAYEIHVSLDDTKDELHAKETIMYKNNSPDQLTFIYMHLWPNGYKDDNTPLGRQLLQDGDLFMHYASEKDHGWIDSLDFKVDGQSVKLEYETNSPDIGKIFLNTPLQPGGQIEISTPFHVHIPSGKISRLGHIGQQYQITQWYPKPAVYDKDGWEQIPYLNQGEFYSEFGIFDVYISLPKNYVLGATGDIQDNQPEKDFLDSIAKASKDIALYNKKDDQFPESSKEWKTVHYHQEHVHDFAWFCDKRYHVLKGEVELPHTHAKVTTWVMYTNQYADIWKDAIPYVNDALFYYSKWNGDYTYDVCTAVDGALSAGGGMEYPNITVIGAASNAMMLDIVITHEVGHNWFYGMLGSNERKHAWMDEGINSANEERYVATKYPNAALVGGKAGPSKVSHIFDLDQYSHAAEYYEGYAFCARTASDQPIETHSKDFTTINYGTIVYMKSAVVFTYLRAYLGDSLYDKCFQNYFDKWHWHHPMPEDIRAVFEQTTGKNLSWFFDDLIDTDKKIDFKLKAWDKFPATDAKYPNAYGVEVKNVGEVAGPVCVNAIKDGRVVATKWFDPLPVSDTVGFCIFPAGDYDAFEIDQPGNIPEINRKNNTAYTHGVLRKVEPLKLQFGGSLDDAHRTQLFYVPALGFNMYDKFMFGAAVYNHVIPGKTFEWTAVPMYSFGDHSIVGHADAFLNFKPNGFIHDWRIGANANMYHYYTVQPYDYPEGTQTPDRRFVFKKVAPEMKFNFKKCYPRSPISQSLRLRGIWLQTNQFQYTVNVGPVSNIETITEIKAPVKEYYEAMYSISSSRKINGWDANLVFQGGDYMNKLQVTGNYHLTIMKNKNIDFRFFTGTFLKTLPEDAGRYSFKTSSWGPLGIGNQDYLFDNIFFGRSEQNGLFAQQMAIADGGFKIPTAVGRSDQWLSALDVTIPMPVQNKYLSHIKFFADGAICSTQASGIRPFQYEAGIQLSIIRGGFCDVFFPLVYSKDIKDEIQANDLKFGNLIRFTFNIGSFNPSEIAKSIQL